MSEHSFCIEEEADTLALSARIAAACEGGELLILEGELGAGKTFFAGGFCRALGHDPEEPVVSPTFGLVIAYDTVPPIEHADLYRLTRGEEVRELGLVERRDAGAILLVEWGERFRRELGDDALLLSFSSRPRLVRLRASGPTSRALLERLKREAG
ncbi:MAG: tRNA (adenosine(37)-N6)-threonylcarbamoyltransferase complex ATPase subunit type 1 TsaE [Muricomes sp.]